MCALKNIFVHWKYICALGKLFVHWDTYFSALENIFVHWKIYFYTGKLICALKNMSVMCSDQYICTEIFICALHIWATVSKQ